MSQPSDINPRIVETLYCEALVLSDEVRSAFSLSSRSDDGEDNDLVRIALSSEGLRATTRMMHAIAWLLNHRAFFMGELTEFQLRRHGHLSRELNGTDQTNLALLDPQIAELVKTTDHFYARLMRLDRGWRQLDEHRPNAIAHLRERLSHRIGHGG